MVGARSLERDRWSLYALRPHRVFQQLRESEMGSRTYVMRQRHSGWIIIPGTSGRTMALNISDQ